MTCKISISENVMFVFISINVGYCLQVSMIFCFIIHAHIMALVVDLTVIFTQITTDHHYLKIVYYLLSYFGITFNTRSKKPLIMLESFSNKHNYLLNNTWFVRPTKKLSDFWSRRASPQTRTSAFLFICCETMSNCNQNCWIDWNSDALSFK